MAVPDVVVVGGGVVGCACARELAARGLRVTLFERSELAAGASGRNQGLLLTPPDPVLAPMARASLAVYREAVERSAVPVFLDHDPIGLLLAAVDQEERDAARAQAEATMASGVAGELLAGDAARDAEPSLGPDVAEAWLLEDVRRVDPASLTVALALEARDAGAEVRRNLPVRALLTRGGAIRGVATDEGVVPAGTVVVATGPGVSRLLRPLGIEIPVAAVRGWLVHLGAAGGLIRRVVEGGSRHLISGHGPRPVLARDLAHGESDASVAPLIHPAPDGTIMVGSSRGAALGEDPGDPSVPGAILRGALRLVPALGGLPVLATWWGIRPVTPDDRPIVGSLREGLILAGGHGSLGVILAEGTAQLVAAEVAGADPPMDAAPFRPERFGTLG